MTPSERVRAYYDDLSSGDADAVARHFTEDAIHYYTRRAPHLGARAIAENAAAAVQYLDAQWVLENLVGDDEIAVSSRHGTGYAAVTVAFSDVRYSPSAVAAPTSSPGARCRVAGRSCWASSSRSATSCRSACCCSAP